MDYESDDDIYFQEGINFLYSDSSDTEEENEKEIYENTEEEDEYLVLPESFCGADCWSSDEEITDDEMYFEEFEADDDMI